MTQSARPASIPRGTQPNPLFTSIGREPDQGANYIPDGEQIQPALASPRGATNRDEIESGLTAKSVFLNTGMRDRGAIWKIARCLPFRETLQHACCRRAICD